MAKKAPSLITTDRNVGISQRNKNKERKQIMHPSIYFGITFMVAKMCLLFGGMALIRQGWLEMAMGAVMIGLFIYLEIEPCLAPRSRATKVLPPSTLNKTRLHYEDLKH